MAIMDDLHCDKCKKPYYGDRQQHCFKGWCSTCLRSEREEIYKEKFIELDKLSTEERIRKIERWILGHIGINGVY